MNIPSFSKTICSVNGNKVKFLKDCRAFLSDIGVRSGRPYKVEIFFGSPLDSGYGVVKLGGPGATVSASHNASLRGGRHDGVFFTVNGKKYLEDLSSEDVARMIRDSK